jgi:hypothetical protein
MAALAPKSTCSPRTSPLTASPTKPSFASAYLRSGAKCALEATWDRSTEPSRHLPSRLRDLVNPVRCASLNAQTLAKKRIGAGLLFF